MKKIKQLTASLLLGFLSTTAFGEDAQPTSTATPNVVQAPASQPASVQAVQNNTVVANPNSVNINTASAAEIQDKMVGIGAKKAQAIVDYRTKNGAFVSVEQLKEVSGIGDATLEKNKDRITLQ